MDMLLRLGQVLVGLMDGVVGHGVSHRHRMVIQVGVVVMTVMVVGKRGGGGAGHGHRVRDREDDGTAVTSHHVRTHHNPTPGLLLLLLLDVEM